MKKIALLILLIVSGTSAIAQYSINKSKYDPTYYGYQRSDPYNPFLCGKASSIIPGLGQILAGEPGRGFAFMGGAVICLSTFLLGFINVAETHEDAGAYVALCGIAAYITLGLVCVADAENVAKVNNLAFRDRYKTGYRYNVRPMLSFSHNGKSAGLGLSLNF